MKTKKNLKWVAASIALFSFVGMIGLGSKTVNFQDKAKWEVPAAAKKTANPTDPADKESAAVGKALFTKHCKSCHGKEGKGDGPKAAELDTPCGDFTTAEFQAQTDGEIFYKTKEGRDDMPSFKKKITEEEDVWLVVNFVRTLK